MSAATREAGSPLERILDILADAAEELAADNDAAARRLPGVDHATRDVVLEIGGIQTTCTARIAYVYTTAEPGACDCPPWPACAEILSVKAGAGELLGALTPILRELERDLCEARES